MDEGPSLDCWGPRATHRCSARPCNHRCADGEMILGAIRPIACHTLHGTSIEEIHP